MNKLSDKKIKKLIWGLSTVICCLLIYFVCLSFYKNSIRSGGKIEGLEILIAIIFTVSLVFIIFLISFVTALFLIDCLRISQLTLIRNKITAILTVMNVLILFITSVIDFEKLPNINRLYQAFIFLIIPITVILLSRFVLQKTRKYPILLGLASLIAFNVFGFMYLSITGIAGGEGVGLVLFVLFESIAVGFVSIVVNLIEIKKIKTISGRAIK